MKTPELGASDRLELIKRLTRRVQELQDERTDLLNENTELRRDLRKAREALASEFGMPEEVQEFVGRRL